MSACSGFDFHSVNTVSDVYYNLDIIGTLPYRLLLEFIPRWMEMIHHFFEFDCSSMTGPWSVSLLFWGLVLNALRDLQAPRHYTS
jgi:hypothetical protein